MIKLIALFAIASVVAAKPGLSPIIGKLISEKTIESHGNSVIHSTAPVLAAAPVVPVVAPAIPIAKTTTIESHGNSVIHSAAPLLAAAPAIPLAKAEIIAEKTIESHGNSVTHPTGALLAAPLPAKAAIIAEKTIEAHGHSIVHHQAPVIGTLAQPIIQTYAYGAIPIAEKIAEKIEPAAAKESKEAEKPNEEKLDKVILRSPAILPQITPIVYSAPGYYYPAYAAPAPAIIAEKTISNYGHSVFHHGA